jgi:hypothetical protein
MKKKKVFGKKPKMGRIPIAPPSQCHRDKTKFFRKEKHKKNEE